MKHLIPIVTCLVWLPAAAAAQSQPAAPPPAGALPATPLPAPKPVPAPQPVVPAWFDLDLRLDHLPELQFRLHGLQDEIDRHVVDNIELHANLFADQTDAVAEEAREHARIVADDVRAAIADQTAALRQDWNVEHNPFLKPFVFQGPAIAGRGSDEASVYNNGHVALRDRQYDRAITLFDRVVAMKGPHADGALYWKAFSQARLIRTDDALATLMVLRRDFPQSRYLADATVLDADVRKLAGQPVDPRTLDANDEIKLLAISGIANTDPDRAIPLLENVLNANNTLTIKRGALYVLALSDDARAQQILMRYAKGGSTPELQVEAIRYLASRRDAPDRSAEFRALYASTSDPDVRRAIIDAYRLGGDKTALLAIARDKAEKVEVRRTAIGSLSRLAEATDLWALYQIEPDAALRGQIVTVLTSMGAVDQLVEVARTEKDAGVRQRALRGLGGQGLDRTGQLLLNMYGGLPDRDSKRAVLSALSAQSNVDGLIAIARKEGDMELKRDAVRYLSDLAPKHKGAADYLMEVIR
jgi:TolA-binding protein